MRRSWALLLAGATIGIVGTLLVEHLGFSYPLLVALLFILIALFLVGTGADFEIMHRHHLSVRRKRPRVGILDEIEWSSQGHKISAWSDISPAEWQKEIAEQAAKEGMNLQVDLIRTRSNFDPYNVVINPYGGTYPEQDLVSFATLDKVFNYVQEGGMFVNVADIPGYWAYHPLLKKRTETAPPIWEVGRMQGDQVGLRSLRPFTVVPWMKRLGLNVLNVEKLDLVTEIETATGSRTGPIRLHRLAMLEENVRAIHRVTARDEADRSVELASIFFVDHGEGSFLISLVFLLAQEESVKQELKSFLIEQMLSILQG